MKFKNPLETSIYYHDQFSKIKFSLIKKFVDDHLEKQAELFDLFGEINNFVNYKNNDRGNFFEAENNIMGLRNLLTIAGISDPKHLEIFEGIALEGFTSDGTARDRAIKIHDLWREKALELRDERPEDESNLN